MTELTADDIERLESIRDANARRGPEHVTPHGSVPREECQEWRSRRQRGERPADFVNETEWSLQTIKRHIGGLCQHEEAES